MPSHSPNPFSRSDSNFVIDKSLSSTIASAVSETRLKSLEYNRLELQGRKPSPGERRLRSSPCVQGSVSLPLGASGAVPFCFAVPDKKPSAVHFLSYSYHVHHL